MILKTKIKLQYEREKEQNVLPILTKALKVA